MYTYLFPNYYIKQNLIDECNQSLIFIYQLMFLIWNPLQNIVIK